jgi:hypothetical protein
MQDTYSFRCFCIMDEGHNMDNSSESGEDKPGEPHAPPVEMGPEKSLKGFKRIEVKRGVDEFVTGVGGIETKHH